MLNCHSKRSSAALTREDHNCILSALVLGVREVGANCEALVGIRCTQGDLNILLPIFLISPTAVPSCLTPTAQHWPGGLDAIVLLEVKCPVG